MIQIFVKTFREMITLEVDADIGMQILVKTLMEFGGMLFFVESV